MLNTVLRVVGYEHPVFEKHVGEVEQSVVREPVALAAVEAVATLVADVRPQLVAIAPGNHVGSGIEEVPVAAVDLEPALAAPVQNGLLAVAVVPQIGDFGGGHIAGLERCCDRLEPGHIEPHAVEYGGDGGVFDLGVVLWHGHSHRMDGD